MCLLDTDEVSVGNWQRDEAADFVYYPEKLDDAGGSVYRILQRVTGESKSGMLSPTGSGEWKLVELRR